MKHRFALGFASLVVACGCASAQGLYYTGSEAQESMPLRWVVGANLTYDDNVTPGLGTKDGSMGINPYVGASVISITPQTTIDAYGRLGLIYYLDSPDAVGADDTFGQARLGLNVSHRFSDRLRLSSRNFIAYELEPDFSLGVATTRQVGEYLYWQTDNALGFRWTERLGTYTGFQLTELDYSDISNADRFTTTLYHQFRYLLSPQTVLTAVYRYSKTDANGLASDSTSHYLLGGAEHRFSPNSILIARAGVQWRDVDLGSSTTSPFLELAVNTQVNQQLRIRSFMRYSDEPYDTVQQFQNQLYDFDERETLRIGVTGEYVLSPMMTLFGGVDYINGSYDGGRLLGGGVGTLNGRSDDLINLHVGVSVKLTEILTGTASYNFTDSSSDFQGRDYTRNRVSIGVHAEF